MIKVLGGMEDKRKTGKKEKEKRTPKGKGGQVVILSFAEEGKMEN